MNKAVSKEEFINWLSEHETAYNDFCTYFIDIYHDNQNVFNELEVDELAFWLADHETLSKDFIHRFSDASFDEISRMDEEEVCRKVEELFGVM